MRDELRTAWDMIVRATDIDGDGRVSRDEFYAAGAWLSEVLSKYDDAKGEWPLASWIETLFVLIDADADGRITQHEYADWLQALRLADDTDIDAAFAGLDKNHDGTLSRDEFAECSRQFWTVFDTTVPGHRWIGP